MDMNDIIVKKRDGGRLSREEICWFVDSYTAGDVPDYQAAALLMAIYFRGMDDGETFELTEAMERSGERVDLSAIRGIKVDKHSTGGVGDKMTIIVAPIAASCGVPVAKMSGRGLGFTGGTVDKLEAVPGFRTTLEPAEFRRQVNDIGIALIGQSGHITPADKKLYALRDVTGTVENLSLIASSIMSKKLAAGSEAILLDVKCGRGAFMEDIKQAEKLADIMCRIGNSAGRRTAATLTDMSQPLGFAVGNALEVMEAIDTLKGRGPGDVRELAVHLAGLMTVLGDRAADYDEGREMAEKALSSGRALERFAMLIERQGGDPSVIDDYAAFGPEDPSLEIKAARGGYVNAVDARAIGLASQHTGAGRAVKDAAIDHMAGIVLKAKVGYKVKKGDVLAVLYGRGDRPGAAAGPAQGAFDISDSCTETPALVRETIGI